MEDPMSGRELRSGKGTAHGRRMRRMAVMDRLDHRRDSGGSRGSSGAKCDRSRGAGRRRRLHLQAVQAIEDGQGGALSPWKPGSGFHRWRMVGCFPHPSGVAPPDRQNGQGRAISRQPLREDASDCVGRRQQEAAVPECSRIRQGGRQETGGPQGKRHGDFSRSGTAMKGLHGSWTAKDAVHEPGSSISGQDRQLRSVPSLSVQW